MKFAKKVKTWFALGAHTKKGKMKKRKMYKYKKKL